MQVETLRHCFNLRKEEKKTKVETFFFFSCTYYSSFNTNTVREAYLLKHATSFEIPAVTCPAFIMSFSFPPAHRLLPVCQSPQFYQTCEWIWALQSYCKSEDRWLHDLGIILTFFIVYIRAMCRGVNWDQNLFVRWCYIKYSRRWHFPGY